MQFPAQSLLDTTPAWIRFTLVSFSTALLTLGFGSLLGLTTTYAITPFTLFLHLVWAVAVSAWVLNLKMRLRRDKKGALALGVAMVVGSFWVTIQQWLAYISGGLINDITVVGAAMMMDLTGGVVSYVIYNLNVLRKKNA